MWVVNGQNLTMVEGDFGIQLPVTIDGTTFAANDEIKFTLKTAMNGETLVEKTFPYAEISENTVNLELTEIESATLPVGTYIYSLDWFQDGAFMCNIIPFATFKVVDKA